MTGVVHAAIDGGVKKLVVVSLARKDSLIDLPAMLAALLEIVVEAEARYLGPDSATDICCSRLTMHYAPSTLHQLADFAFEAAANGDIIVLQIDGLERIPCRIIEMRRED